jgi:ABC-2 type transport system ATP-binding protein
MLEVRELSKAFGRTYAVDRVSFAIRPGEILGYLGPNGSGKSTTVKMLTGLLVPTSGQILYNGSDIREDPEDYKSRLGYVPEEPYLYPYLTGREFLQMVGQLRQLPDRTVAGRADSLLQLFGLDAARHSTISSYSKGMRQKVLISAALLSDPELLIFDEPLSGLDVTSALVFRNLVQMLVGSGKTVLYSSHVLDVVEKLCTRVLILRKGQVVADDSVERLRDLMSLPSLEDVFSQLAVQEDTGQVARDILAAMHA